MGLRWTPLTHSAVTGYRITVVTVGGSQPIVRDTVDRSTGRYTVVGLEPGVDYDISVATVTENGESTPVTHTMHTQTGDLTASTDYRLGVGEREGGGRG